MKVLLDTNVILDVLLKREPFFADSYKVMKMSTENAVECIISASAVTDIFYILNRHFHDVNICKTYIYKLIQLVSVSDVNADDIQTALSIDISDFEDALVTGIAMKNKAEYIITRNVKDFDTKYIKILTPKDFTEQI
jgi:Predicted nucleic acid-binding protein, contains PIN domain